MLYRAGNGKAGMGEAIEDEDMIEALSGYPLMNPEQIAVFLSCSSNTVAGLLEQGVIPCVDLGLGNRHAYRADPVHVAVFLLAGSEGITPGEFWERHGPDGTLEHCARLVTRIRKIQTTH